jgi:phosphate transport system substrate-binding protein
MNLCRTLLAGLITLMPTAGLADIRVPDSTHVEIRGSLAMGSVARLVAERYMHDHPDAVVTVAGGGTRRGLKSLIVGTGDLAMGTDGIPEDIEKLASDSGVKITAHTVFSDAVVVVVNPSNPVKDLSMRDLRDIFRGKILRWSDVGRDLARSSAPAIVDAGAAVHEVAPKAVVSRDTTRKPAHLPDAAAPEQDDIQVVTFEGSQGAYETFKKEVLGDEYVITPRAREVSTRDFYGAITDRAIGYVGIHGVRQLKMLTVDGVVGSVENVRAGRYPITRKLAIFQKEPVTPSVASVVEYFLDPAIGQTIADSLGNVPVR